MTGPPPELFANTLEGAGYLPCAAIRSLNRPLATSLSHEPWVFVWRFDYSLHGGSVPPTKTISDWWPILGRDEFVSVRGDYVSVHPSRTQLTLSGESAASGLRRRMTIRQLQHHFDRRRGAGDEDVDDGNRLNATEIRIIPNSALSRTYQRPIQIREEDMTRFVDTKGKWGKDHVMMAQKGSWVGWHQDPFGACAYIRVIHGAKIILMEHPLDRSRCFARMSDADVIFMRPGLRHAVWTLEDSVCLVGDLYLPGMMTSQHEYWNESNKLVKGGESVQTYLRACIAVFEALYDDVHQDAQPRVRGVDPHLVESQYRPLMSVLTRRCNTDSKDIGHIAA